MLFAYIVFKKLRVKVEGTRTSSICKKKLDDICQRGNVTHLYTE